MTRMLFILLSILLLPTYAAAHGDQQKGPVELTQMSASILELMGKIAQDPANLGADDSAAMDKLHEIIVSTEDQLGHYAEALAKTEPERALRLRSASGQFLAQVNEFHTALHDKNEEQTQRALTRAGSAHKLLALLLK
jgi:hypothetical protein